jgi:hypothetical protein
VGALAQRIGDLHRLAVLWVVAQVPVGAVGLLDADQVAVAVVAVARDPAQRVGDAQQIAVDVALVVRLRAVGRDQRVVGEAKP